MFGELLRRYDLRFYFGFEKGNWKGMMCLNRL